MNTRHLLSLAPDALVCTDRGEVAAVRLTEGQRLLTRDAGFCAPFRLGITDPTDEFIIHIGKGALGHGLPTAPLALQPADRILLPGYPSRMSCEALVEAQTLVALPGATVESSGSERVVLWFNAPVILLVNGAWLAAAEAWETMDRPTVRGVLCPKAQDIGAAA